MTTKVIRNRRSKNTFGISTLVAGFLLTGSLASFAQNIELETNRAGALYVLTNSRAQNAVAVFQRGADGTLSAAGIASTGGSGTGDLLDSQGSLILSSDKRMLFAVNALSNEISSLAVDEKGGISLVDRVASGGERPNSITVKGDLLYVLNTGGSGNISGFRVSSSGRLSHIEGSTSALSTTATFPCPRQGDAGRVCSAAGPGQVQFTPQGDSLVVTERLTSRVLTYRVNNDGTATLASVFQSEANSTPFGFDFAPRGRLIVTNNFLDTPGLGAASSYIVNRHGNLEQVTGLLANNQTASCWVVIANQGRVAITSNPRTSNLTTYAIRNDGSISILNAVAASIINGDPHDLSLSSDERFLFALNNAHATVSSFKVEPDGTVTPLAQQAAVGLPAFSVGMAAR